MRSTAVLVAVLALAACGGDDEEPRVVEIETAATVTAPTKTQTIVRTVTRVETVTEREVVRTTRNRTTPVVTVTTPQNTADPAERTTGRPRFNVTLSAAGHEAEPGRRWSYVVRATKRGRPAGGTAKMRVFIGDVLVDTIGFFAFSGELRRTHVWPRSLSGKRVVLQAEVEGEGGTRRVNWPVTID